MLLALFLQHVHTTQITTTTCNLLIVDVLLDGKDRGMGIVGMQDHKLLILLGISI